MPSPHAVPITLIAADRAAPEGWTRRRKAAQAPALRARIALACAETGATNGQVAGRLGVGRPTVATWRRRFAGRGPDGLLDTPRPGAPRRITDERVERALTATPEAGPPNAPHGSTRSLAAAGLSQLAVARIWRAFAPEQAIHCCIAATNEDPKPFAWTKSADDVLASVHRFRQRTSNLDH